MQVLEIRICLAMRERGGGYWNARGYKPMTAATMFPFISPISGMFIPNTDVKKEGGS